MKIIKCDLPDKAPVQIMPLADLHIGDRQVDYKAIANAITTIMETPGMYTILDGDLMNTAIVGSKSDIYHEEITPYEQLGRCVDIFKPLADKGKILGILPGNHEERISRTAGVDMTAILAKELGLEEVYSPTSSLFFLRFGSSTKDKGRKQVYTVYVNHGNRGGGIRAGGKINALEDLAKICVADCYVCGHTHFPATFRKQIIVPNSQNCSVSYKEQLFVNTCSWLRWSDSYGDRAGYTPNSMNPPIITLQPTEHRIGVIA